MFGFFKAVGQAIWNTIQAIGYGTFKVTWSQALSLATLAVGVKGFMQARQMLAKGQDILANKTAAGGKIPVIYGTRRVGAQIIYMDVSSNNSRDLYVVYALSVGECDEILGRTIELDGNPLTDSARFRNGGYIGSDKISSGSGSLNTVSQNGAHSVSVGGGGFGTNPAAKYRYVMNLHHGAASQTADPMLVASMPNWTSAHRLDGVCYIAAHYGFDNNGMWSGVPQLTVQVRGKKVYDPRDSGQTFGNPSTYEYSDNPALCFLDYITNNEYGKGLTQSQINMSTFSSAANVCDTLVDQPYFNGTAQSLTWSGNAGDDFITIGGANANLNWWQNKIGEQIYIYDANGDGVIDGADIKEIQRNQFYDSNEQYIVYINDTLGSTYSSQTGTSLLKVKRFHCNGYLDTNKNVMENAKELLANMRGMFLYINGQYELSIEDTGASTFSINDNHIISDAGISVDYGNKDKKANKVIVEFFNANKKYELDTATVLHDATPEYYSDDNDEILEIKAEFPYISDPYIAYNMGKAILTRSRNQTTMQFLGTPEMYKLNVGDIVDLTYAGLGFSGKVCRVEALELQPNGLVAVSLIEYFDVYTWEVPPQEPVEELANLPSAYAVKKPTNLSFTDTDSSSTGRPFLSWDAPTDYPDYEFRVNVVDSSGNQLVNRIVNTTEAELNFTPTGNNYVASVTSLNTLGTESDATTLTFTIGDAPTATADIQDDAIVTDKIVDNAVTDAKINSLSANKITAGTIDASQITVTNIDADNITSGTVATARLNVNDIISTGSIIVSGDNVTDLTNNAGYVDVSGAASAAPVQSVAGATGAVSASTIITAGNIVVQGDNISTLTNNENFIDGTQVNSNVTSISGGVITTGTINGSVVNVTNINADNITTGSLSADNIQIDDVTLDSDGSGNLIIKSGGVGTNQIANNAITTILINDDAITTAKIIDDAVTNALIATDAVNQDSIAANSVTATEIVANTITASEIAASTITAAQIASNTITANEMAADSITADEINVATLDAISANMGAITAGTINNTTNTPTAGQEPTGSQAGTAIDLASGSFTFGNVNAFLYFNTTDGLVQGGLTPFRDTVSIYYQGSTAPSSPSDSSMTYTSTGAFSFTTNAPTGWTLSIPNTTDNIYVVQANIGRTGAGTTTASWGAVSLLRAATVTGTSLETSPATIAFTYASTSSTSPESYSNSYTVTASGAYSHSVGITATVSSGTWTSLGASSITVSEVSGDTGEFTISSITHQSNFEEKTWSWTVTHTSSGSTVSQSTLSINPLLT